MSPLVAGISTGTLDPGQVATVQFELRVNAGTAGGTLIVNQARVISTGQPPLLTDGDGNASTGPEPTVVVVGGTQMLTINKQVAVVGGGAALPGAELEYVVVVRNISTVPATLVRIVDDLNATASGQLTYVSASATLNGSSAGISVSGQMITGDYAGAYGDLAPGASATLRFRATLASNVAAGARVTNTGVVNWNNPQQTASASVAFDVGSRIGVGVLSGRAWHDADFNRSPDAGERVLAGWSVALYRNNQLERSTTTDANGAWQIANVAPNAGSSDALEVRFTAPGAWRHGLRYGLMGLPLALLVALALFPLVQGVAAAVCGLALSFGLYGIASQVASRMFGGGLPSGGQITLIEPGQAAAISGAVLLVIVFAVLAAARSAQKLDPASVLREGV